MVRLPIHRCALAAAILLLLLIPRAAAQEADTPGASRQDLTIYTTFGWSSVVPADRWGPMTIEIGALAEPLAGAVVIEYPQDATQFARITVPFATTPGRPTRVQAVVCLPPHPGRLTVTILDDRARRLQTITYGRTSSLQLPPSTRTDNQPLLVTVGRIAAGDALSQWSQALSEVTLGGATAQYGQRQTPEQLWADPALGRCDPADLPLAPIAYDAVHALIVSAESFADADPRAIEVIHQWVRGGGRLVLLASSPGDFWRRWFPDSMPLPIAVEPAAAAPLPQSIAARIQDFDRELQRRAADNPDLAQRPAPLPAPAPVAAQRILQLTDAGRLAGWKIRWTHDQPSPGESPADPPAEESQARAAESEPRAGLLAEGPLGLGWVIVLGIDPARTSATTSNRAAGPIWVDALRQVAEDFAPAMLPATSSYWYGYTSPIPSAISAGIERVGRVPLVGNAIFIIIIAALLLLAGMVGPGDYFLLKRFGISQRSWLTAIAWITLASIAALILPPLIRTDPTQVYRIAVVDALCTPASAAAASPVESSWSTGITGIYTAQSGTATFENADMSSWWRGISAAFSWREFENPAGAVVPIVQAAAGGEAGSTRGGPLLSMPFSLWTFRAFLDQAQPRTPLSVYLQNRGSAPSAVITNLPRGATVTAATLRLRDRWYTLHDAPPEAPAPSPSPVRIVPEPAELQPVPVYPAPPVGEHEPTSWTGVFASSGLTRAPHAWAAAESTEYNPYQVDTSDRPGPILTLPASYSRGITIEHLLKTGRWAALYVRIDNWPPEPAISWSAQYRHTRIFRLLIPIPDGLPEPVEPPSEPEPAKTGTP